MPISGLVVVFESSEALSDQVLQQLFEHTAIEVGKRELDRVAIVVDSTSQDHDRQIWEWLQVLPGVSDIKIAFVGFDEVVDVGAPNGSGEAT